MKVALLLITVVWQKAAFPPYTQLLIASTFAPPRIGSQTKPLFAPCIKEIWTPIQYGVHWAYTSQSSLKSPLGRFHPFSYSSSVHRI